MMTCAGDMHVIWLSPDVTEDDPLGVWGGTCGCGAVTWNANDDAAEPGTADDMLEAMWERS